MIAEEVAELDDEHAAAVEKLIIGRAPKIDQRAVARAGPSGGPVADPKAARRRKEKALKDARVEMFPETSGTAALACRDLPSAGVLAADKHLTALAQAMKAAGQPGTLDILRAWAYLHLLSGKPAATLIPRDPAQPHPLGTPPHRRTPHPVTHPSAAARQPRPREPPGGPTPAPPTPSAPPARRGSARPRRPRTAELRGTVNLTMPLSAWLGWTQSPGDVPGYGPVDAEDSRTLADLLAHRPANQWCVTLTDPNGHPVAHACARHGPPGPRPRASTPPAQHPARAADHPGPGLATWPDLRHPGNQALHPPTPITRLPAQPFAAPPHPGPQPHLHRPGCRRPRPAAIWTTSSPTTAAAAPANATSTRLAATTTTPSKSPAGPSPATSPAPSPGPPPATAATPPPPFEYLG